MNKVITEGFDRMFKSLLNESDERDDIDAIADDKKETAKKVFAKKKDDADADKDYRLKKHDMKEPDQLKEASNLKKLEKAYPELDLTESDAPAALSIEEAQKYVDYDMKRYGKISDKTNELVRKAGFQIIKDDHGDYEVAVGKYESLKEDVDEEEIKINVETLYSDPIQLRVFINTLLNFIETNGLIKKCISYLIKELDIDPAEATDLIEDIFNR